MTLIPTGKIELQYLAAKLPVSANAWLDQLSLTPEFGEDLQEPGRCHDTIWSARGGQNKTCRMKTTAVCRRRWPVRVAA